MISATISPCAIARCASIGSPVTSPIAQTLRIEVRHWSSMRTARPSMSSISVSRPQPSVRGLRPTATSTWSAGSDDSSPCAPRMRTASPPAFKSLHRAAEVQLDAQPSQRRGHRLGELVVVGRQHAVQRLDHRRPRRRACDRRCRAPARCSRRRRRPAAAAASAAPAPRSTRSRARRTAAPAAPPAPSPVASSRCSQPMRSAPPASPVVTSTVLPSTMRAQPPTTCTPLFFSSAATPPVSRATMPSFQRTVCARSMRGDSTRMPSGESLRAMAGLLELARRHGSAPWTECSRR